MKHKHRPCPCGCGDMADECMSPHAWRNPLGAFQIEPPAEHTPADERFHSIQHDCLANAEHTAERGCFCGVCDRFILLAEFS